MKIIAANSTTENYITIINFRFDDNPAGAETFTLEYNKEEDGPLITKTLTGEITGPNTITVKSKIPTQDFKITNSLTNQTLNLTVEEVADDEEDFIEFIVEDGIPVTYIKGFPAKDRYQITARTMDGEIFNTEVRDITPAQGDKTPNDLTEIKSDKRIAIEGAITYNEGWELKDFEEAIIEIDMWESLKIRDYESLIPTGKDETQTINSYKGIIDYQALGLL